MCPTGAPADLTAPRSAAATPAARSGVQGPHAGSGPCQPEVSWASWGSALHKQIGAGRAGGGDDSGPWRRPGSGRFCADDITGREGGRGRLRETGPGVRPGPGQGAVGNARPPRSAGPNRSQDPGPGPLLPPPSLPAPEPERPRGAGSTSPAKSAALPSARRHRIHPAASLHFILPPY